MNTNNPIILFDGVCNLCNRFIQFIIKRDPNARFKFASIQSESGQFILHKLNQSKSSFDSIIYIKENKYFVKSSAGLQILKDLGGPWQVFYVFILIPQFIRDPIYNFIAKKRYKLFGKRDTCMIPSPEIKQRFLE